MKCASFSEVMVRLTTKDYLLLTQTNQLDMRFTGTGMNFLAGLKLCGDEGYLLTCLPQNHIGDAAIASVRSLGIHDQGIKFQGNHIGVFFLEKGIYPRGTYVTYLNRTESSFCQVNYQIEDFEDVLNQVDAIHFCGIALAINEPLAQFTIALATKAKSKGIKIIFDCNFRKSLWEGKDERKASEYYSSMMHLADIAFASTKDATHLNLDITNKTEEEILQQMVDTFQLEMLLGTRRINQTYQGYLVSRNGYFVSQAYPMSDYERIGAGDAFASAAIHKYFQNQTPLEVIDFATAAGALAHTTYSDSPVLSKKEICDFMENGYIDIYR